jgi:hypothetical protein
MTVAVTVAGYCECTNEFGRPPYGRVPPGPDALFEDLERS